MTPPTLSLCLIVRDEEVMLPDFLRSVAGLWDEAIAVDGGSCDATIALLRAAGATVIERPWTDDFAAARNAGLAHATGSWILCLDADERMTPGLAAEIRDLLADQSAGAATVVMRNELPGGHARESNLLRLFRNDPEIRFRHRIHEDVSESVAASLRRTGRRLVPLRGQVHHLGYVREIAADRAKKERDRRLLAACVAEDEGDLYSWYKLLELARFWNDDALWRATARQARGPVEAAVGSADGAAIGDAPWSGELVALIGEGLHDDPTTELAWLEGWDGRVAATPPLLLRRAALRETTGDVRGALSDYESCLDREEWPLRQLVTVRPRMGLCRLAAAAGDLARASELAVAAALAHPRDPEALLAAVSLTGLKGESEASDFVARYRRENGATVDLARALMARGEIAATAELCAELADTEPAAVLGLLTCSLIRGEPFDRRVDLAPEEAEAAFKEWLSLLWSSRRTDAMEALADAAPTVTHVFPWLPEFLGQETRRLATAIPR